MYFYLYFGGYAKQILGFYLKGVLFFTVAYLSYFFTHHFKIV